MREKIHKNSKARSAKIDILFLAEQLFDMRDSNYSFSSNILPYERDKEDVIEVVFPGKQVQDLK